MKRLRIRLDFGISVRDVGELVYENRRLLFRFDPDFVADPLPLSPIRLPITSAAQQADTSVFDGLFGVFADSLPDGWGRLLQDRAFSARQVPPERITPLLRLAAVGTSGMGALTYHPPTDDDAQAEVLDLDYLAQQSQRILAGMSIDDIEEMVRLGGSSGGARPKLLVGYHPTQGTLISDRFPLPEGYTHWIVKFNASMDRPDAALLEYAYALLARRAGLEVSECRLFEGRSGNVYFGTKRFDRTQGTRLHLHSVAGLLHDNFRLSTLDYGHLMDAAIRLTQSRKSAESILRMAAFNVFAYNRDDHSNNFSFLMDATGEWRVAPAYDLTYAPSTHGEHSITVAGEGRNPGTAELLQLGEDFGLSDAASVIAAVKEGVSTYEEVFSSVDIGASTRLEVGKVLERQLMR